MEIEKRPQLPPVAITRPSGSRGSGEQGDLAPLPALAARAGGARVDSLLAQLLERGLHDGVALHLDFVALGHAELQADNFLFEATLNPRAVL